MEFFNCWLKNNYWYLNLKCIRNRPKQSCFFQPGSLQNIPFSRYRFYSVCPGFLLELLRATLIYYLRYPWRNLWMSSSLSFAVGLITDFTLAILVDPLFALFAVNVDRMFVCKVFSFFGICCFKSKVFFVQVSIRIASQDSDNRIFIYFLRREISCIFSGVAQMPSSWLVYDQARDEKGKWVRSRQCF